MDLAHLHGESISTAMATEHVWDIQATGNVFVTRDTMATADSGMCI